MSRTTRTTLEDPFLARLEWIAAATGARLDPPAGPREARTQTAVREAAGLASARALEKWTEGDYPKGTRHLDSLDRLERHCRHALPGYPPPDGHDDLAAAARAGWALREAPPAPPAPPASPARRPRARWALAALGVVVGLVLLLATAYAVTRPGPDPSRPAGSVTSPVAFTFDDLGGGSPNIRVYAGPEATDADRVITGRYPTGDEVTASCVATGRPISSDPSVGEVERTSQLWVRLDWTGPEEQYATVVYGQVDLSRLPACAA